MIRLASIDGKPLVAIGQSSQIATQAQGFADALNEGRLTAIQALIVTVDEDGSIDFAWIGDNARCDQAIGILELAKAKIIAATFR